MTADLSLRLLDNPRLSLGQQALPALPPLDAALLAVLALDGAQSRQAVAALLWPDADAAGAATNLRQRIFRFKRQAGQVVVQGDRSIALADGLRHDLQNYAEQLAHNPLHGRGELLGNLNFPAHEALSAWLAAQREALAQTRGRVLAHSAQQHLNQGRHTVALEYAQAWVHHAPLQEQAHRLVIQLLHQLDDRAGALAAYRRCEHTLLAELGVEPSQATVEMLAQVMEASPPANAPAPSIPLALLRPPRLVAREEPWRRMAQAAAQGQVLVLEGEAGMGKSRLLTDFMASHAGWCRVASSPGDAAVPFALLARLLSLCTTQWGRPVEDWVARELARLAPEAGAPATDTFALLRLTQAVRAAVGGWQAQGLAGVALDDLHYADASSMDLLLPLCSRSSESGLPWLLATRPAALAGEAAASGLAALPRLRLQPLPLPAVEELVNTLNLDGVRAEVWAPALLQRTGGNPLFLLQTLTAAFEARTLADGTVQAGLPLPQSLQALLVARLERLSPAARSIARLACVAGPDFTLELACQLLDAKPATLADPWLELQTAHVMDEGRFAHDLIRDATADITPPAVRRLIHAQVAQALEQAGAPPGRIAGHWDAANRWMEAAAAYERAAQQAHTHGAKQDEQDKLQAATRCHRASGLPQAQAAAFATALRALEIGIGNTQLGDDSRQACEALLATAATDQQRAQAQVLLAHFWCERYEPALGLPPAQAALQWAQASQDQPLTLLAAQRVGGALSRLGQFEEAVQTLRPLAPRLQVLPLDQRLNWLTDFGLTLDYADQRSEALVVLDSVITEACAHQRWAVAAAALSPKSNVLVYLGRTLEGFEAMEQSLVLCKRAGIEGAGLLVDEATSAGNLRDLGHFSRYLARAERLPQALRDAGSAFWAANAEHDLATAFAWLGRADLALRALSSNTDDLPPVMRAARLTTRARLARDYGVGTAGPRPQALMQQARALMDETQVSSRSHIRLTIALQSARDAEPEAALAIATELQAQGLQRQNLMLAANAGCVRLRVLLASGDLAAAAEVASEWMQRLGDNGPPAGIYAPEMWWLAWRSLLQGQPQQALAVLNRAVNWIRTTATDHVPELYRQSFLTRNPVNAELLSIAQKYEL